MVENWYWEFLEYAANLVEAIIMFVMLQYFFKARFKAKWPYILSTLGVFGLISVLNKLNVPMEVNIIFYILVGILMGFFLFSGSLSGRILIPMLMVVLIVISEVVALGIVSLSFQISDNQLTNETPYRMMGIIISKVLLIAMVSIAGRFSKKENYKLPLLFNLCLMVIPVFTITSMITILQYTVNKVESIISPIWLAVSAVGLLFVNLLIVYLFEAFMNYSRNQSQYQLMSQQAEMLGNHLRETNALQEETHRIWHDMKNHFTVIQWMVKSRSYEKLEQYMQTLNDTVVNSMPAVQSGNPILDAILNPRAVEAKKYGIELTVNACIPPRLSIVDIDLNILFSNALDNAFEACRKLPEDSVRFIDVDAYLKSDHLVLVIKNTFNGEVSMAGNELKTTKKEKGVHGIGMGNMLKTVEKYDGHIVTKIEENIFILSAILYCSIQVEKAV